MFERYTEKARRSIFFARYEASQFGATEIEAHHLLLAVLRESNLVRDANIAGEIRRKIERKFIKGPVIATSVDIPLTRESKKILLLGAQEAGDSGEINCAHLLLGILKTDSFAAELMREAGFAYEVVRGIASSMTPGGLAAVVEALLPVVARIKSLPASLPCVPGVVEIEGRRMEREVVLGWLVESACSYLESLRFSAREPPAEAKFGGVRWEELEQTWRFLNRLIANTLANVQAERATEELSAGAEAYAGFCERVARALVGG